MLKGGKRYLVEDLSEIYKSYANEVNRFLLCLTSSEDCIEFCGAQTEYCMDATICGSP